MVGEIVSGARRVPLDDLLARGARAASGLAAAGIGKGDTVALLMRNDPVFFEASVAAGLLGAYPVPVNWHYTPDEAAHVLSDSGARALVVHLPGGGRVEVADEGQVKMVAALLRALEKSC